MSMDERDPASEAPMEALSKATAPSDEPSAPEGESESFWSRRTFFKSAALGTAAAAMYEAGSGALFGPLVAYADNLSGLNCTANDVRIPGPAQILNEPCACSGSFNAQVQFRVINNTGTTRYCVTAHLCPATLPNGSTFDPGDIVIGDVPPKSDALYTVTVPNYPCGSGLVCFGAAGPEADGGFPKGAPCPAGACCSTVSWDVNTGCPSRVLSSKCRHQQICIQGRGGATLDCDTSLTGVQSNCAVACGGTTTLRLCTTEAASFGPFTFSLSDGQSVTGTGPCADFTVGPITDTATFTGTRHEQRWLREVGVGHADYDGDHRRAGGERRRAVWRRRLDVHRIDRAGGMHVRLLRRRSVGPELDGSDVHLFGQPRRRLPHGERGGDVRRLRQCAGLHHRLAVCDHDDALLTRHDVMVPETASSPRPLRSDDMADITETPQPPRRRR